MASTYLQKFPVPEHFPEILHDLLREILREQPEDIIKFSYNYFKEKHEGIRADPPTKNYYGKQIDRQRAADKSETIAHPAYKGAKADPFKVEKAIHRDPSEATSHGAQANHSHKAHTEEGDHLSHHKSEDHRSQHHHEHDTKSQGTDTSNKTNKQATNEYYNDLTDKVLNMYDESASGSRPRTSGEGISVDGNRNISASVGSYLTQSKKSLQARHQIAEEDENNERSRRSKDDQDF